ncbi:MAG TPA: hypothetical protein VM841_03805 [Actinomycetota bacterium]|nr:hypothetical protein [Actinomycetota bacterium]
MRGTRFGGLLAAGALTLTLTTGTGMAATEDLTSGITGATQDVVPSILPATITPLPDPAAVPGGNEIDLPGVSPPAMGGGDPVPASGGGGGSGGGSGGSGSGSGDAPGPGAGHGGGGSSRTDGGGASDAHGGTRGGTGTGEPGSERGLAPAATLTGSAGTLATNIGRLAKPLGLPLGLAVVAAVMLLIATRRPVALRKVEEEGMWGYEGRSNRL